MEEKIEFQNQETHALTQLSRRLREAEDNHFHKHNYGFKFVGPERGGRGRTNGGGIEGYWSTGQSVGDK